VGTQKIIHGAKVAKSRSKVPHGNKIFCSITLAQDPNPEPQTLRFRGEHNRPPLF